MSTNVAKPIDLPGDTSAPDSGSRNRRGRLNRVSAAVLIALGLAFVLAVQAATGLSASPSDAGADGARLGGDFPAFYAAGQIVLDGDFDELYLAERQQAEQRDLGVNGYLAFAYPPHVAVAYAPLAALSFRAAYAIHTLVMVAALIGALALLRKPVPLIADYWLPAIAATLAFYPLFRAVGGGQNTAISVLIIAVVWRALSDDAEVLAGFAAGLLLFRPQYAIPLICLFIVGRHGQAAVASLVVGLTTWGATTTFMGEDWFLRWIDQVLPFVEADAEVNAKNSISLIGFFQAMLGHDSTIALSIGLVGAVSVAGVLAWFWRAEHEFTIEQRMGVTAVGILLISPHTMFYDAGLLVIAAAGVLAAPIVDTQPLGSLDRRVKMLAILWFSVLVHPLFLTFSPATPLAVVVLGVFGVMAYDLHTSRPALVRA